MTATTPPRRGPRLVLDLPSGTAVIDGEATELPRRELHVLVELAAHPRQVVPTSELIEKVWPDVPGMTPNDLYTHVHRLRRSIRDGRGRPPLICNRRGFGYYLDLPPHEVTVVGPDESGDAAMVPDEEPESALPSESAPTPPPPPAGPPERPELASRASASRWRRRGPLVAPLAVLLAAGLVATSWAVGFELSRRRAPEPAPSPAPSPRVVAPPSPVAEADTEARDRRVRRQRAAQKTRRQRARRQAATTTGISAPAQAQPQESNGGTGGARRSPARSRQEPKLPPPPTSLLYHLYNPDTDDHFVTTDGNVARQQEGRGYEGGAIARVYTYREKNTKPIATNHGTAYIFISSTAKTDPASKTTALYYATDNAGDFFYTTRSSQADKEGWESWVIGYVRRL